MGTLNPSANDVEKAKAYFQAHPDETTYGKKTSGLKYTFIRDEHLMLAFSSKEDFLGKGSSGKVVRGIVVSAKNKSEEGNIYAIKIERRDPRAEDNAELQILQLLGEIHAQIPRVLSEKMKKLYTVLNLKEGQTVAKTISNSIHSVERLKLMIECVKAMQLIHALGIIHGDLNMGNIMVNIRGDHIIVSPIDWGVSMLLAPGTTLAWGVVFGPYTAPEPYISFASDVYSLGYAFEGFDVGGENLDKLLDGMCNDDPDKRPTLNNVITILEHELKEKQKFVSASRNALETHFNEDNLDRIFIQLGEHGEERALSLEDAFDDQDGKEINALLNHSVNKLQYQDIQFEYDNDYNEIFLSEINYEKMKNYLEKENKIQSGVKKVLTPMVAELRNNIEKIHIILKQLADIHKNPSQTLHEHHQALRKYMPLLFNKTQSIFQKIQKITETHLTANERTETLKLLGYFQLEATFDRRKIKNILKDSRTVMHKIRLVELHKINNKIQNRYQKEQALLLEQNRREKEKHDRDEKAQIAQKLQDPQKLMEALLEQKREQLFQIVNIDGFLSEYMLQKGQDIQSRYNTLLGTLFALSKDPARKTQIASYQNLINNLYNEKFVDDPLLRMKILIEYLEELKRDLPMGRSQLKQVVEAQLMHAYQAFPNLKNYTYSTELKEYFDRVSNVKSKPDTSHTP